MIRALKRLLIALEQSIIDFKYNIKHIKNHSGGTYEILFSRLRMFCHMLDKGMNNVHFEKGHSMSVYKSAVNLRDRLASVYKDDSSFIWVNEIIERFEKAQEEGKPKLEFRIPPIYTKQQIADYTCFITNRTSCRNFSDKTIPTDIIEDIVRIAIDAPNGCCRQVVRYYITQNKDKIQQAISHIAGVTNFSNIPCLVCVAAETSYYELIDKNLQFVDASLSAENFILGASLYGVYGTMCNFFHADKNDKKTCRQLFGLKDTENIVMFIAMGYPINIPEKPKRRNLEVFCKIK